MIRKLRYFFINILPGPTMKTVLIVAALFAGIDLVSGGAYDYLCDKTDYENSVTFYNHPTDCSKYVQCWQNSLGKLESLERQCGFTTYWSMSDMTCVRASLGYCQNDLCRNVNDGDHRMAEGNCRGYWQCERGISVPKCCPSGQHYNSSYGCEDNIDGECTDDCLGKYVAPVVSTNDTDSGNTTDTMQDLTTTEVPIICDKQEIAGKPSSYNWNVNSWSYQMDCPSGTVFVQKECSCLSSEKAALTCRPELLLTFTNGLMDASRNKLEVRNVSVMVENGEAVFDGVKSQLVIPFFTNLDIKDTLIVRMKYTSDHTEILEGETRALFSNFDCSVEPSIQMTENSQNLTALVGTWEQFSVSVDVPQKPLAANETVSEKNVVYKFHKNQLSLSVGSDSNSVETKPGQLRKIQCALHIGYASGMKNFKGRIDEFAVYQCDPEA
ncbi:PIF-like protein [Mya arenaria]|uniref:PIF-like protein n=2 Tax=Mya arenaria TaxID=6604 RepID=A0ABY7FE14_MYAAR|nr:PIF-like protein [Mya arenaria]